MKISSRSAIAPSGTLRAAIQSLAVLEQIGHLGEAVARLHFGHLELESSWWVDSLLG